MSQGVSLGSASSCRRRGDVYDVHPGGAPVWIVSPADLTLRILLLFLMPPPMCMQQTNGLLRGGTCGVAVRAEPWAAWFCALWCGVRGAPSG
jgi:hypothetical protein